MSTRKLISVILMTLGIGFAIGWTVCDFYPNINPTLIYLPIGLLGFLLDIE